nr:hypothetical protein [Tanacetum cinerariifolium]
MGLLSYLKPMVLTLSLLKGQGSPSRNKTLGPWSALIPMLQLFKGLGGNEYDKSGQNEAKSNKAEHAIEKSAKNQSQRQTHLKSNPLNPLTLKNLKTITPLAILSNLIRGLDVEGYERLRSMAWKAIRD